jgi:hypothetical protein
MRRFRTRSTPRQTKCGITDASRVRRESRRLLTAQRSCAGRFGRAVTIRTSVVLPEPLGPILGTAVRTSNVTSSTATRSPKFRLTPRTETIVDVSESGDWGTASAFGTFRAHGL